MVYSESVAPLKVVAAGPGGAAGASNPRFSFFETVIASIKPVFATGVRSVVVAGEPGKPRGNAGIATEFLEHLQRHHAYLFKKGDRAIHVSTVAGTARDVDEVSQLARSVAFKDATAGTMVRETASILDVLDASINNPNRDAEHFFTLDEIDALFSALREEDNPVVPEYLLMTDTFWAAHKGDARLQRAMAIAKRTRTKTRVIQAATEAGSRVAAFGGLVCIASPPGEDADDPSG